MAWEIPSSFAVVCAAAGVSGSPSVWWALSILARMSRATKAPEAEKEVWVPVAEKFELHDDEKFKRKNFKRPPIYLRQDQPKNKWIVKPTRLDLLKDADDVLEALVQNKVPRNRRFEQRARRKKKNGSGPSKPARKVVHPGDALAAAVAAEDRHGQKKPRRPAEPSADGKTKAKGGRKEKFIGANVQRKQLALAEHDPHKPAWSSKMAITKYQQTGYDMPTGRQQAINALHDPAHNHYPGHQERRNELKYQKSSIHAPRITMAGTKADLAEDSYFDDEENGGSSSDDEANVKGTVYMRIKAKIDAYRDNNELKRQLFAKADDFVKEAEIRSGKYASGKNFVTEHSRGVHLQGAESLARHRKHKIQTEHDKGKEIRAARALKYLEDQALASNRIKEKMDRPNAKKRRSEAARRHKQWLVALTIGATLQFFSSRLPLKAKTKPARCRVSKQRRSAVVRVHVDEQREQREALEKKVLVLQTLFRQWLANNKVRRRRRHLDIVTTVVGKWTRKWRKGRNDAAVGVMKCFLEDYSTKYMVRVIKKYRNCVVNAQRMFRQYRECKHARVVAFMLRWDRLELEYAKRLQMKKSNELKTAVRDLREKGAGEKQDRLSIHQRRLERIKFGINDEPADLCLGEEPAALLEHHLLLGLENIIEKSAPSNHVPVSFDIRFMMLHKFLTRIRRKYSVLVASIKAERRVKAQLVSIDDLKRMEEAGIHMSVQESIALRPYEPLPSFHPLTGVTNQQMLNLVKEGHEYEQKFNALGMPFESDLVPLPGVKAFFQQRRKVKKNAYA
jgi:hypothetical protein